MAVNTNGASFARIRSLIQNESGATVTIGRFVLKAPFRARNLSIEELAQACGASAATVHRFCRDLGYGGYKEWGIDRSVLNSDFRIAAGARSLIPLANVVSENVALLFGVKSHVARGHGGLGGLVLTIDKRLESRGLEGVHVHTLLSSRVRRSEQVRVRSAQVLP
jgi:hypothetical protein